MRYMFPIVRYFGAGSIQQVYVLYDVSANRAFTQILASKRKVVFDIGCRTFFDASLLNDSLLTTQIICREAALPDSVFFRAKILAFYTNNVYSSSYSNTIVTQIIRNPTAAPDPAAPNVFNPKNISKSEFGTFWNLGGASNGPQTNYIDVATDSLFKNTLPQYTNIEVPGNLFNATGLQPNTQYYFRTRNTGEQGTTPYSRTVPVRTLPAAYPFRMTYSGIKFFLLQLANPVCNLSYVYQPASNMTIDEAEAMLAAMGQQGLPVDSAWFQDNTTCNPAVKGGSEFVVKLKSPNDAAMKQFGFGNRQMLWGSNCGCKNFRQYFNFMTTSVGIAAQTNDLPPQSLTIKNNAPNPFSDGTAITFSLPHAAMVVVDVVDVMGRVIKTLADSYHSSGDHTVELRREDLHAPGVYFVRVQSPDVRGNAEARVLPISAMW